MQSPEPPDLDIEEKNSLRDNLRKWMVSGFAIAVPILVTVFVFRFAMNLLLDSVGPISSLLDTLGISGPYVPDILALVTLFLLIFLIGFLVETSRASRRFETIFDNAMSSIPGLGAVYSSFNEMSQILIDSETQSFQEVKLVEYPTQGSYCVAFVTAETSENIREATNSPDMTTLYLPMAPNPVMGGFVVHVEQDSVYDIDMTVEEGMRSVVTSGVAVNNPGEARESPQTTIPESAASDSDPANDATSTP